MILGLFPFILTFLQWRFLPYDKIHFMLRILILWLIVPLIIHSLQKYLKVNTVFGEDYSLVIFVSLIPTYFYYFVVFCEEEMNQWKNSIFWKRISGNSELKFTFKKNKLLIYLICGWLLFKIYIQ